MSKAKYPTRMQARHCLAPFKRILLEIQSGDVNVVDGQMVIIDDGKAYNVCEIIDNFLGTISRIGITVKDDAIRIIQNKLKATEGITKKELDDGFVYFKYLEDAYMRTQISKILDANIYLLVNGNK